MQHSCPLTLQPSLLSCSTGPPCQQAPNLLQSAAACGAAAAGAFS